MLSISEIKEKFKNLGIVEQIITIHVIIYVLILVLKLFGSFFHALPNYLILPLDLNKSIKQPWSFISYFFIHSSIRELLWNMLMLYSVGRFGQTFFSPKKITSIYLMGGIACGILTVLICNLIPGLRFMQNYHLIGSSGALSALFFTITSFRPDSNISLFFLAKLKIKHIAFAILGINILMFLEQLSSNSTANIGGVISCLTAGLFGYIYSQNLIKGNDPTRYFDRVIEQIIVYIRKILNIFSKKNKDYKTTTRNKKENPSKNKDQKKIDTILDKINESGYDKLSSKEKAFLFKASKKE